MLISKAMNDFPHGFLLRELNIQLLVLSQHMHFFFASYIHNSYAKHTKIFGSWGEKVPTSPVIYLNVLKHDSEEQYRLSRPIDIA